MNLSERAVMNAKWYCTNGMILTVLANVVENQTVSLFTAVCALLQYVMVAFELGSYQRYRRIEKVEQEEARKRVKKLLKDIQNVNAELDEALKKKTK